MYAVKLESLGDAPRYLRKDLMFDHDIDKAETYGVMSTALTAIHSRGFQAAQKGWQTGNGYLAIIIVEEAKRLKETRVVV